MRWSAPPPSCCVKADSRRSATAPWRAARVSRWASTTYYFSSLDDLIASAVAHIGLLEVAQLRAQVATLSRRRRGAETTADLLVDLLVGSEPKQRLTEQLISRYERHIACARLPGLREIQRRNLRQRVNAVAEVIVMVGTLGVGPVRRGDRSAPLTAQWFRPWSTTARIHGLSRGRL